VTATSTEIFAKRTAQLLYRITLQMNKQGERVLQEKHDLTLSQFFFLMQMINGRQCQRELADSLSVTPAAVSRQAALLMKRGYVRRIAHKDDRRYGFGGISAE
jgi:DNA-binding MarR family transcriptional regulator